MISKSITSSHTKQGNFRFFSQSVMQGSYSLISVTYSWTTPTSAKVSKSDVEKSDQSAKDLATELFGEEAALMRQPVCCMHMDRYVDHSVTRFVIFTRYLSALCKTLAIDGGYLLEHPSLPFGFSELGMFQTSLYWMPNCSPIICQSTLMITHCSTWYDTIAM